LESRNNALIVGSGGEVGDLLQITDAAKTFGEGELARVSQKHVRAVASRGDEIFFGTGGEGVLYRYNMQTKKLDALWQAGDAKTSVNAEILAVAADKDAVYFGTSTSGTIYRWSERDGVQPLYASPQKVVYALQLAPNGVLYAATGNAGVVYRIEPGKNGSDAQVARLLEPDQRQSLALALAPKGSTLLIGTGNNGAAYRVALGEAGSGTYYSPIFDAKSTAHWGNLRTISRSAEIETRSGNTAEPDASWSDWQPLRPNELGEYAVASPPARYLQYRVNLSESTSTPGAAALSRIEVAYRAVNHAPTVALTVPRGGEYWMGKKKITWTGKDPDSDTLFYRAYLSSDDGATWQALGDAASKTASFELDSSKYPDGVYRLKVVGSDAAANPEDPREDQAISLPIVIDNTVPTLDAVLTPGEGGWKLQGVASDATSPISGVEWHYVAADKASESAENKPTTVFATITKATSAAEADDAEDEDATDSATTTVKPDAAKTSAVTAASKDADWRAAAPADGIFDSRREAFVALAPAAFLPKAQSTAEGAASTAKEEKTIFKIEVRVFDAAGNRTTQSFELPAQ
jgi:hypothetical protein